MATDRRIPASLQLCPALIAAAAASLAGCGGPFLRVEDRVEACRPVVQQNFEQALYRRNSLSSDKGTLSGAGQGFLAGLQGGYGAIITVPLFTLIGAGYGTACAAASASHPNADADFERLLHEADVQALRRALEERLKAPRPECRKAEGQPDSTIYIDRIEGTMACLQGRQEFGIVVKWRTVTANGRTLQEGTLKVSHKSAREVDDWFAHPEEARKEIDALFADAGRRMAKQFVADN